MDTTAYLKRLFALWLALPLTALDYLAAWSRLPERVPMHTGPSGKVDSFTSPEGALGFAMGLLAFILVVNTGVGFAVAVQKPSRMSAALWVLGGGVVFATALTNGVLWLYQVE